MVAGALIVRIGTAGAFAANALAYMPIIVTAVLLHPPQGQNKAVPQQGVLSQMREGFAYAVKTPVILNMLLSFAALACTARGIMELAPSIAATALQGGVETLSVLTSSLALGALFAGIWLSRAGSRSERSMIVGTLTGSAAALVGYGASSRVPFAVIGAAFLGFMLAANNISVTSAIQVHSAPQYRGRINGLYNVIFKGGPAVGAAVFGWAGQHFSIRFASVIAATLLLVSTALLASRWPARLPARVPLN
jgi:MFS family permease